jgi:hypothetical protein
MPIDNSRAFVNYDSRFDPPDDEQPEPEEGKINNSIEMCKYVSAENEEQARRHVYKYTNCGAWISFERQGIKIGSIVEGCDFGTRSYLLEYPFTPELYDRVIGAIEKEADATWKWANEEDSGREQGVDAPDVYLDYPDLDEYATAG